MALTADDIRRQLRLPRGAAWTATAGGVLDRVLQAGADELARIFGRAEQLLDEAHPDTVDELLAEWEVEYGLPFKCASPTQTVEERRAAIATKLRAQGGQSRQYYIDVAAGLGIAITITECRPFYVGVHGCGDPIGEIDWAFTWIVTAPPGSDLALLDCVLGEIAPAHTRLHIEEAS